MSNQLKSLIEVDGSGVEAGRELLLTTAASNSFLPYIQLFTTKSDAVTEGKIVGGRYGIVRDGNITDLGDDVNFIFLEIRARAFLQEDGDITVVYVQTTEGKAMDNVEYARISALQDAKVIGAMCGPEFLLWVPTEECFATFFCGSLTLKRESRKLGLYLGGKAANMRSKICQSRDKVHKWHGPVVTDCSIALQPLPTKEEVEEQIDKFKNPPKQDKGERVSDDNKDQVVR